MWIIARKQNKLFVEYKARVLALAVRKFLCEFKKKKKNKKKKEKKKDDDIGPDKLSDRLNKLLVKLRLPKYRVYIR